MPSPAIPPTVSQPVARAFKYLARPYAELAESLNKDEALSECLTTHDAEYVRDQNLGLIQQVLDRREMIKISKLQDTYVAISLEDVAKKVCPSEPSPEDIQRMESVIVRMIDDGELNATISESPPIVTFFSDTSIPSRSEYEKVLSSITAINARLKKLDRSVGLSPSYIKRVKPPGGQGNVSPTDADDAKDAKWTSMREPESGNEKRGKGRKGSVTDM